MELTDKNGANLAGNYEVDPANNTCTFVGNATTVTLNCGEGVALNTETETVMYFVLPAGVFDGGFTAVVKNTTGGEMYTLSTTRANLIVAEKILEMPTVNVAAIGVTTGTAVAGDVPTTMTLNGSYSAPAGMSVSEVGFYFGQGADLTKYPATLNNPFSLVRDGLAEGTEYSYQAYAVNGSNEILGSVETFTTSVSFVAPMVTTGAAEAATSFTGTGHATLTDAGTGPVTGLGICWGTEENPEVTANNHAALLYGAIPEVGTEYTFNITNLNEDETYYVRAYAVVRENYESYYYYAANTVSIHTPVAPLAGILDGEFTINAAGGKVNFSQGNLQYNKTTEEWSFMDRQYDMVGTEGQYVGTNYARQDIVSHFCWGTSGYNHGANNYQPWSTDNSPSNYKAYGDANKNLYDETGQADWGYNAITNGGNTEGQWRTLTKDEWSYMFNSRSTTSGVRYAGATVNGVGGVILLPDDWSTSTYALNGTNGANVNSNTINATDWTNILEANGAVFLPVAGYRDRTTITYVNGYGFYWSSTTSEGGSAYYVSLQSGSLYYSFGQSKGVGMCVRLVKDVR